MTDYIPELGQAVFGQPHKELEVPRIVEAALLMISEELNRVQSNKYSDWNNPFDNTGNKYECPIFTVEAYSWNEDYAQPFNFKWRGFQVSWYKYFGRGMSMNREISSMELIYMLNECMDYLDKEDTKQLKELGIL